MNKQAVVHLENETDAEGCTLYDSIHIKILKMQSHSGEEGLLDPAWL